MGSATRKKELRQISYERKIELFGILESKLKDDGISSLKIEMPEWDIFTNLEINGEEDRASIIIGFLNAQWSGQILSIH